MNNEVEELFSEFVPTGDEEITKDIDAGRVGWVVLPCFKIAVNNDGEIELVSNRVATWLFERIFVHFWTGKVHLYRKD